MGNTPSRDGGTPDPTGGTDCAHPAIGATDTAEVATAADQYTTRHNPFVWFHSVIDNTAECNANVVPLGTLGRQRHALALGPPRPRPAQREHDAALRLHHAQPVQRRARRHLCRPQQHRRPRRRAHRGRPVPAGLDAAHPGLARLQARRHARRHHLRRVRPRRDRRQRSACCNEQSGPNTHAPGDAGDTTDSQAPGGGQIGALLLNSKYIVPGSTDTTGSYNHYSALRSYEDLLGLTTGGADGEGHLGFAAAKGLAPFGTDVFPAKLSGQKK